jgi:glycosyltransferase involved in cell wall biosynthesis
MHEDFIEDALGGFLAQKTSFRFEILVRDDGSTDATQEILRHYANRYPGIFFLDLASVRQFPRYQAGPALREKARGRYIAMCEGDDYWTDERKLSKQVALLERDSKFVMSHHSFLEVEDGVVLDPTIKGGERNFSSGEVQRAPAMRTLTTLARNIALDRHPFESEILNADVFYRSQIGQYGGSVFAFDVLPGVYRIHPGGIWSSRSSEQRLVTSASSFFWIAWYYQRRGKKTLASHYVVKGLRRVMSSLLGLSPKEQRILLRQALKDRRRTRAGGKTTAVGLLLEKVYQRISSRLLVFRGR